MNALSWNCRGLGNQHAVSVLSHLVREKAPKIVFLMDTKQTVDEMQKIKDELNFKEDLLYHVMEVGVAWRCFGKKLTVMPRTQQ